MSGFAVIRSDADGARLYTDHSLLSGRVVSHNKPRWSTLDEAHAAGALGDQVRAELHDGELVLLPEPSFQHRTVQEQLRDHLNPHGSGGPRRGWVIRIEHPVMLTAGVTFVPDLVGWCLPALPPPHDRAAIRAAVAGRRPDWVCEVLSPSNPQADLVYKPARYAEAGIPFYWVIDPDAGIVVAFERRGGARALHYRENDRAVYVAGGDPDATVTLPPFDRAIRPAYIFEPPGRPIAPIPDRLPPAA